MYYDYYLYYLSYFSSLYIGYPLVIRVTVVMVSVLILISLFGFLQLLVVGYKVTRNERRINKTKSYFEGKLRFIMKSSTDYELEEVGQLLEYDVNKTKHWRVDILTDIVLSIKDELNKEGFLNEINYKNTLEALRIMGFWEKRVRKSGLSKRREALQVIGQMGNGMNVSTLSKSTFHKDRYLRKTARELFTSHDNYNPFKFMEDNFDESFTALDKLRLHSTLVKRDREAQLPNLLRWINNSKNIEYVIFIFREIAFFKQYEAVPTLLMMLDKQDNKAVRAQIVYTIGELGNSEHIPSLKERYSFELTLVRESIIIALGKIKANISLQFLIECYRNSQDSNLKLLIARSIKLHGEEGQNALRSFQSNINNKLNEGTILEHVISERTVTHA